MKRQPVLLSDSLSHRLNSYALLASAAGVGMLALAQPAQAKIVYTKTHQKLLLKNPNFLDLNNDGVIDFSLILQSTYAPGVHTTSLAIGDYVVGGPNRIAGSTEGWASALRAGARIKSAGLARGDMEHVKSN